MSCCLRQSCSLPKSLIFNRKPCPKYLSTISVCYDKQTRHVSNKLICLQLHQPKQIQVRHSSYLNLNYFYESVSSSNGCKLFKQILVDAHDITGLSWFATIVGSAVLLKLLVSVPCGIFQQHLLAKLELTKIEHDGKFKSILERVLLQAKKENWAKDKFMYTLKTEAKKEWKTLIVKNNCHPSKATVLFLLQFPFWLLMTIAIRSLATEGRTGLSEHPVAALQFTIGGPFWCQNLTVPDPNFVFPTISFLALLANTEITVSSKSPPKVAENKLFSFVNKSLPIFLRLFTVVFFFISARSPAGVSLFWASSSVFAVLQSLLLLSPKIRRFFKIPKTPSEYDRPYNKTWTTFLEKLYYQKNNEIKT